MWCVGIAHEAADILGQPFSDAGASGRPSPRGSVGTRRKKRVVSRDGDVPPTMGVSLADRLWRVVEWGAPDPHCKRLTNQEIKADLRVRRSAITQV